MAFIIAAIFGVTVVALAEDAWYFATGIVFWDTWKLHPISIFAGISAFLALLYFLQRINHDPHALEYLEPYAPLFVLSSANLLLHWNPAWLLPVALACLAWSAAQVRKFRGRRTLAGRMSALK